MRSQQNRPLSDSFLDGQPPALEAGTGWVIADGLTLTAAHVIYEYDRNFTASNIVTGSNIIEHDDRGYGARYKSAVLALKLAGSISANQNPTIEAALIAFDRVVIQMGGPVDSNDAGLVVFLDASDMPSINSILAGSVITRYGYTTGALAGNILAASAGSFTFDVASDLGDSGAAYILTSPTLDDAAASGAAAVRGFVLGVQAAQDGHLDATGTHVIPTGPAHGTYFDQVEWADLNKMIGNKISHLLPLNVTGSEPVNLVVGRSTGDGTITGSFRADIILGRGGDDFLVGDDTRTPDIYGNDELFGGADNDSFRGGRGFDLLHGGDHRAYGPAASTPVRMPIVDDGIDTADYTDQTKSIVIKLVPVAQGDQTFAVTPDFANAIFVETTADDYLDISALAYKTTSDTLISIEKIKGSDYKDVVYIKSLTALPLANSLGKGGLAEIDLRGETPAPTDSSAPGDLIDFSDMTEAVRVNLSTGRVELVSNSAVGLKILDAERVDGGHGNDEITGNDKDNKLTGHEGNDTFVGGKGSDEFWGGVGGTDTNAGGEVDKVTYASSPGSIHVNFNGSSTIANLTVDDGEGGTDTLHSIEEIVGSAAHDLFQFTGVIPNNYFLKIESGSVSETRLQIINALAAGSGIHFANTATGGMLTTSIGPNAGQIELVGFHTQIVGSIYNDVIIDDASGNKKINGGWGDDEISVSIGAALIDGGTGDDTITGGSGNDTIFGGDGSDIIHGGDGSDYLVSAPNYESVVFLDNDQLYGGAGADYLSTGSGSWGTLLSGGAGNDVIDARASQDSVISFASGDGHDVIVEGSRIHHIDMSSLSKSQVTFVWDPQTIIENIPPNGTPTDTPGVLLMRGDLVIRINGTGDTILLRNVEGASTYWDDPSEALDPPFDAQYDAFELSLPDIIFSDGPLAFRDLYGATQLVGVEFSSVADYATALVEYMAAVAIAPEDLTGGAGDDELTGGRGDDSISAGDGDDWIDSSGGNDSVDGGDGQDTLGLFGALADFEISRDEDGNIVVTDLSGLEGEIVTTGVERFYFATDDRTYTQDDLFGYFGTEGDDTLTGSDKDNQMFGLGGDDVIDGGAGNDSIDGGAGADVAVYHGASTDYSIYYDTEGALHVSDDVGSDGFDTLANVETLTFAGDETTVVVADVAPLGTAGDDVITGSARRDFLYGLAGNDTLDGLDGDDVLFGGAGNDIYHIGAGGDFAGDEEGGDDLYDYSGGGDVAISDFGGTDIVQIAAGIAPADVIVESVGEATSYRLSFAGAAGSIYIASGALADRGIEQIRFDDGTVWSVADLQALLTPINTISGTEGDDALTGLAGQRNALFGFGGNDTLTGWQSIDWLDGGNGNDILYGLGGADVLDGGTGDDILHGGDGDDSMTDDSSGGVDQLFGEEGDDTLWGGSSDQVDGGDGDDILSIRGSNGTFVGGAGDDSFSFGSDGTMSNIIEGGDGYDTVTFTSAAVGLSSICNVELLYGGASPENRVEVTFDSDVDLSAAIYQGHLTLIAGNEAGMTIIAPQVPAAQWPDIWIWPPLELGPPLDVNDLPPYVDPPVLLSSTDLSIAMYGAAGDDMLVGSGSNDELYGKAGDDVLNGGGGNDSLFGGIGSDIAIYASSIQHYTISTNNGKIQVADGGLNEAAWPGMTTDTVIGVETLRFADMDLSVTSPIVLDLDGDGTELLAAWQTEAAFDMDGDGKLDDTSWFGSGDAMLFLDRDGNGTVTNAGEFSFTQDLADASSDLDGLRAFDSNGDGKLTAADARFGDFRLWQDRNGDGVAAADEITTLAVSRIAAIALGGTPTSLSLAPGSAVALNFGSFTRTDGTGGQFADAVFSYFSGADSLSTPISRTRQSFDIESDRYWIVADDGQMFVRPVKATGMLDPSAGPIGAASHLGFGNRIAGMLAPIVLDPDGNGVKLRGRTDSEARFDKDGDGSRDHTGWIGKGDGLPVIDRHGDALITSSAELSFPSEEPGARSDLEASTGAFTGWGNSLNNYMWGGAGSDVPHGGGGHDTLTGGASDHWPVGGDADDLLVGASGTDILTGGVGAGRFRISSWESWTGTGADRVSDFVSGDNLINLSGIDPSFLSTGDQAFTFIGSAAFSGSAGELRYAYDGVDTWLQADLDGDASVDIEIILTGDVTPLASDFIL